MHDFDRVVVLTARHFLLMHDFDRVLVLTARQHSLLFIHLYYSRTIMPFHLRNLVFL